MRIRHFSWLLFVAPDGTSLLELEKKRTPATRTSPIRTVGVMKTGKLFGICMGIIACVWMILSALPVRADAYQIYYIGDSQWQRFYGLAADGTAVVTNADYCDTGTAVLLCYETVVNGSVMSDTTVIPSLDYDEGIPCTPAVPGGMTLGNGMCNGDLEAFTTDAGEILTGTDVTDDLVVSHIFDDSVMALNASGDIVYRAGDDNDFYEAVDLTKQTPEPGSLLLLSTGVLAVAGMARRRIWGSMRTQHHLGKPTVCRGRRRGLFR